MGKAAGSVMITATELPVAKRALVALLANHLSGCRCGVCGVGRPLLGRIEERLLTPVAKGKARRTS